MTLHLYNSMSRAIERFEPLEPGRVSMYTCGPTVYNFAHVGNFRTFLFEDLLRRWLEASGYEVFHVMNLTDVDDKTIAGARRTGQPLEAFTAPFIQAFHEDAAYLRIRAAHAYPRATAFIAPMVRLVEDLLARGVAYRGDDGSVYFRIAAFPEYGRLSRLDTRELRTGAGGRVQADEYAKEDAQDFVLWKAARGDDELVGAAWDAPFGRGRPGWHLECSAMALALVGERFGTRVLDIHAGGVDLIFPHHEDEIAQSCAHTGEADFARWWVHGEFLNIAGSKMSKRYGNILTARDLRDQGVDAGTVRTLICSTHYRKTLDWSDDALAAAREGSRRLGAFRDALLARLQEVATEAEAPAFAEAAARFEATFRAAMDDDLNAPKALAAFFEFARVGNGLLAAGVVPGAGARQALALADAVLDVAAEPAQRELVGWRGEQAAPGAPLGEVPPEEREAQRAWALAWAGRRLEAKKARNFAESDRIRALLRSAGWEVRDNRDGTAEVVREGGV